MKALVTGHGGFVGRHMWRALRDRGYELVGVDIAPPGRDSRFSDDLRSLRPQDARNFFREDNNHYDLVVHCAAIVGGRVTIDGAPLKIAVDLAIDAEMFQWAFRTLPGRIVYYSSSAAYPIDLQAKATRRYKPHSLAEQEIDLDRVRNPDMTYGWAKLTGETLARFAESEGLPL